VDCFVIALLLRSSGKCNAQALRLGSRRRSAISPHLWALAVMFAPVGSAANEKQRAAFLERASAPVFLSFAQKKGSPLLY
jgi:hypothetical protein